MGWFDSREEKAAKQAEKDAKQRAKNKAWHEQNAAKSAVIRGASKKRNDVQLAAARAAGYDIRTDGNGNVTGLYGTTAATKRSAKDELTRLVGGDTRKAEKMIKQEAERVAKEFGGK